MTMDMQEILSQVITRTNEIFEAEAGSVALFDSIKQEIVIQAAVGAGADAVRGVSLPADQGVLGWVFSHGQPALIPDVTQDSRFYQHIDNYSGFQTRSIMCAPLRADGHIIGALELMNMRPDYLSDSGLKILSVIADHAALAIENARLFEQTRQHSEEQAMLFEALAIVTSDLALETVLDAVSRQMVEALKADLCIISDWERESNQLRPMQSYAGNSLKRVNRPICPLDGASFPLSILTSQTPCTIHTQASGLTLEQQAWLDSLKVQSLCLIPLIYRRQTIGLVELGRVSTAEPLTQHELRLLQMMTVQAAVAIEHARLYDETNLRLAEARVLQEVMVAAASSLDFDRVLSGTISALHRTLGIERLGFFLPSPDGDTIIAHPATIGFNFEAGIPKIPRQGSAIGWVIRHGKPLLLPDVREANDYYELNGDTQSEICVPVALKSGQVVAVLNAESPRINAFNRDDLRLFKAIAAELAVALENAQLFAEIRAAEANYRDLFDNANDFIFTLDSRFRVSNANKVALKASGYQLAEIIGAHATQFVAPQDQPKLYRLLKQSFIATELTPTFEFPVYGKHGQEILLEITFRVQRDQHRRRSLHCIGRDITHRRELEQQLQQTEKLSAIGKLVAGVAHELNNPLTTIIGYSSLLQQSDLPTRFRGDVDVIVRQAQRARFIVQDLLTFARRFELDTKQVDVNELVSGTLSLLKNQLQVGAIHVTTSLDFGLPLTLADPHQLEQVFVNLVTNAIQAMSLTPEPRQLTIESRRVGKSIILSFADNGPGIPPEAISRIFDPFFSTKQVGQGTGLGLSICFGIIAKHNGRIWAENLPQEGAIFYVELPITTSTLPVQVPAPEAVMHAPAVMLRILAIDDELPLLNLITRVLGRKGHTVETVPDGEAAWHKLMTQTYDLVISDILMPGIFGPELYQKVIQTHPHLKDRFIFITGNTVDLETKLFLEKSGVIWLPKPFLPADLEKAVNEVAATMKSLVSD
ncbi:MAG: GAF domain-containing protein [Anaerolineae bacterium]